MAITPKPPRAPARDTEAAATEFIMGATPPPQAPEKAKKEPVILRFDGVLLKKIDARASRMGLSRAAWVRMVLTEKLAEEA